MLSRALLVTKGRLTATRLHLPHAIVVRLHVRKTDFVILTPKTVDLICCLNSSLSLSEAFSIQDVAQSALQGAHCHADVVYLGVWGLWYSGLGLH